MKRLVIFLVASLTCSPLAAGEVEQIERGMVVTTDSGEKVRVTAFADGTFRVTVARELPEGRPTRMVVAVPDGEPVFSRRDNVAYLQTAKSSAAVNLATGRLTVFDPAGKVLLDEHVQARAIDPVKIEGQDWFATRVQFNRGTDEGLYGLGQHQNRQMNYNGDDLELAQHNMAITVP